MTIDFVARDDATRALSQLSPALRNEGWTLIATNPAMYSATSAVSATPVDATYRTRHVATAKASKLRLVYGNFASLSAGALSDPFNDILVGASIQKAGATPADQTGYNAEAWFRNGMPETQIGRGALVSTEPAFFDVAKNEAFFVNTHIGNVLPAGPASAPTLAEVLTGGTLVGAATYNVCIVYVFPDGLESVSSAGAAITTTTAANTRQITVTTPAAAAGAIGWRAYMTGRNASISGQYFRIPATAPIGTNISITAEVSNFNTRQIKAGGQLAIPVGGGIAGNTNFAGLNTGEGAATTGDYTFSPSSVGITEQNLANLYSPVAILGKVNGAAPPTVAIIGDSIAAGTGDHGYVLACGGHTTRALTNQLSLKFDTTAAPLYGHVRVPLGSEKAQQFAATLSTNQTNRARLALTELASNVISNYGTNDLGDGLAAMKVAILQIAAWYVARGIKFFQCTLLPKTTSTDGFQTVANQTVQATESTRLAFNAWIRDTSASGFLAQAGGSLVGVIDVGKYIEVNASNVLTQDGGFWRIPPTTVYASGTFTAVSSNAQFTDSALVTAANTYKGYNVVVTSGVAAGKSGCIYYQNGGVINTSSSIGATPGVADAYQIMLLSTIDGTHPSSQGHVWGAQAVQEALPQLQS